MVARAALLISVYVTALFAGCVGSEAGPAAAGAGQTEAPVVAPPAEFDDDTGAIEGQIHDDSLSPVAGATVGLLDTDVPPTVSSVDGMYTFSRVPPGTYKIVAQKLGYDAVAKSITVEAGVSTRADLTIIPIAIVEPYHEVLSATGLLGCSLSWRPAPPPPANYVGVSACGVVASDLDKFIVYLKLTGKPSEWNGTVYEFSWRTTQATGKGMSAPFETDGCSNVGKSRFARMAGYSPLRVWHSPETHAEKFQNNTESTCGNKDRCNENKCTMMVRAFSNPDTLGASAPADIGVTVQQSFKAHMSVFYNGPAPELWSALADT